MTKTKPVAHPKLLAEIEEFIKETGIGECYFGAKAISNSALIKRLRKGGRIWPETIAEVRAFMAAERSSAGDPADLVEVFENV